MNNIQVYIGYAAGILAFLPFVFLIISMRNGGTKPNLAGWVLYTVAMIMIVTSSIALNAWQTVWLAMAYVLGQSLVIGISFKTGYFAFTRFDYGCLFISLFGLLLWVFTNDALYALVLNVFVDAMGTLAIANKLYKHPQTEDANAWSISLGVALLNTLAIASFDLSNALYPIYLVFANAVIVVLSFRKKLIQT